MKKKLKKNLQGGPATGRTLNPLRAIHTKRQAPGEKMDEPVPATTVFVEDLTERERTRAACKQKVRQILDRTAGWGITF